MARIVDTTETRMTLRKLFRRPKYRFMAANRIVPHLPWVVLFALAALLYKARIFADSGFYVTQFINNKFFWIECQRIVLAISQVIPLIGVWAGIPIKYVLLLYSLSHVLFFYLLFLFVYYGLRDRRSGLLIIIFQTVGIMHSFFTPMFELYYGAPLLITFYAIWRLPYRSTGTLITLLIIEILVLLSHPLAFMLFLYLIFYDYKRKTAKPLGYYLAIALVFLAAVAFKAFVMCDYESGKLAWQFNYTENKQYLQFLNPAYYKVLGIFMLKYYGEVLIVLVISMIMLMVRKEWFRLLLVLGTFLAYLFLVNSAYTVSPSRYMEQVMFPFVPIVFITLIYGFRTVGRQGLQNVGVLLISALIVYRLLVIYNGSEIFMLRVRQMEQLIDVARQKGGSKFVVSQANVDHGYSQLNWSYPLETLLLSAIDGNDIALTIVPEEDLYFEGNRAKLHADQFLFRRWEIKDSKWLNQRYFHLDLGPYRTLNDSSANTYALEGSNNFKIQIDAKKYYQALDTVWIPIKIINLGSSSMFSNKSNNVKLSYLWLQDQNVLNWDEIRTPLQADIVRSLSQDIKVAIPQVKGKLQLKVDILANGQWIGANSLTDILVY